MTFYTLKIYIENSTLKEKYNEIISNHNTSVVNTFPNAGFDLLTPSNISVESEIFMLDTKIICAMFDSNNNPVSYFLYPRSSITKTKFRLANSVGIIDSGYRGHIIGAFDMIDFPIILLQYTRLIQICAPNLGPIIVKIVDSVEELSDTTDRGTGGFGSTGK